MRLIINGVDIELSPNVNIAKTLQVNDIGSVSTRQANYTSTFSIPKTANNVKALNFLSIEGNVSNVPYQKNEAYLYSDSGECLVYKGWAVISETSNSFKCNIYDGIVDLYKRIENKTLSDLDITALQHEKTVANVLATQDLSKPYVYILADYNGKVLFNNKINVDYLVPAVKVPWIVSKIEEFTGFTFNGSFKTNPDFTNLYLTQPKPTPPILGSNVLSSTDVAPDRVQILASEVPELYPSFNSGTTIDNTVLAITGTSQTKIKAVKGVKIKAIFVINPDIAIPDGTGNNYIPYAKFNGQTFLCDGTTRIISANYILAQDEEIDFRLLFLSNPEDGFIYPTFTVPDFFVSATLTQFTNDALFESEFDGMQISQFMNELLWRFNLTIFKDKYSNSYTFKYLNEILNTPAIDWSDKFNGLESESYIYGNYGQVNYLKHKYDDQNSKYNDGTIEVANTNIPADKTIIQSVIYSPEYNLTTGIGFLSSVYKFWEKEPKDNGTVNYKPLANRFFFLRATPITFSPIKTLISETLEEEATITNAQREISARLSFSEIVPLYYNEIGALLNQSKVLNVNMRLTENDIVDMDFSKPVYIKQLGGSFMVNKINNFIPYKNTKVELIKINK